MNPTDVKSSAELGQLRMWKRENDPPLWFLDIDGQSVELTTDDLLSPRRFQICCMDQLHILPEIPGPRKWQEIVAAKMRSVIVST